MESSRRRPSLLERQEQLLAQQGFSTSAASAAGRPERPPQRGGASGLSSGFLSRNDRLLERQGRGNATGSQRQAGVHVSHRARREILSEVPVTQVFLQPGN